LTWAGSEENLLKTQHPGTAEPFRIAPAKPVAYTSLVKDLQRKVLTPPAVFPGSKPPLAPIAPHPQGGGYLLWAAHANNHVYLTRVDATGNVVGADEDLGAGLPGAVGSDGTRVAYLIKIGNDKLEFRVKGGQTTVIMDNDYYSTNRYDWSYPLRHSGRGVNWGVYGAEAMWNPINARRVTVVPTDTRWFATFDHCNNLNAVSNPAKGNSHCASAITMYNLDGSQPSMPSGWLTSHTLDLGTLYDGERIINIGLGDAFPMDFNLHAFDK
jgi:hypothetical protein